jgi:hypothetical protein
MSFHNYPPVTVSTSLPLDASRESKQDVIIADLKNIPLNIQKGPNGVFTQLNVAKDTADSANTVAVPVEIVSGSGTEINITAGDLNVQTSAYGPNYDSMRIGDGINELAINANLEALTRDADAIAELVAIKNASEAQLKPVDYIDSAVGPLLNAATDTIPSATFLELVATTAAPIKKIQVIDEIGEFMALYTGAALSETLLCGLGLGGSLIDVDIPAGTRISIQSLAGNITAGRMFINFLG